MDTARGMYAIETVITDEPWLENCYIVRDVLTGQKVIIDPGWNAPRIIDAIKKQEGLLKAIILTHAHHDHVGAVAEIQEYFKVPCFLHEADKKILHQAHTYAFVFAKRNIQPIRNVDFIKETDFTSLLKWPITMVHTPGHSAGSVSYFIDGNLFTGDTLLFEHIGRVDTPGADTDAIMASIERLLQFPNDTTIYPGHGRTWNVADAKQWWQKVRVAPPVYKQFGGL